MNWRQILAYPLRLAPLWLLVIVAALLAFVGPPLIEGLGLRLLLIVVWALVLWVVWRYAVVLCRSATEGIADPPAFAIEMANPFEALPYRPVLAMILRAPLALGSAWPQLLLCWSLCIAGTAAIAAGQAVVPRLLQYAIDIYAFWLSASALGAALHWRRAALAYRPVHSPERTAELRALEHERQRRVLLDGLYQQIRMQHYRSGAELLNAWLAALASQQAEAEARHLFQQLCQWGDAAALARLTTILVGYLCSHRLGVVALEFIVVAEQQSAEFRPASLPEAPALAELARRTGQQRLAVRLEDAAS